MAPVAQWDDVRNQHQQLQRELQGELLGGVKTVWRKHRSPRLVSSES
jgi:hypothetical protein